MTDTEGATTAQGSASLFAKMAKVMGSVRRVPKSGKNNFHNYQYATESDVLDTVRVAMAENNIGFFASIISVERSVHGQTSKGKDNLMTTVVFEFTFADGDTGATYSCHWQGEALDTEDKGISKAATLAEKYFLLKTFMISTGDPVDDPDSGHDGDAPAKPKSQPRPAANVTPITDTGKDMNGQRRAGTPRADGGWPQAVTLAATHEAVIKLYDNANHRKGMINKLMEFDILDDNLSVQQVVERIEAYAEERAFEKATGDGTDADKQARALSNVRKRYGIGELKPTGTE